MTTFMKHLQRVRINIDQNLGRAEKSEVLNEYEQNLERRVELLKTVCQNLHKKVITFLRSQSSPGADVEKRLKKLPESGLSHCLIESSVQFGQDTGTGQIFHLSGDAQGAIATIVLAMETDIEQRIIVPIRDMVEVDYPQIQKLKKQMKTCILDMDSAKQRYANAQKQAQSGMQTKLDEARIEVEDSNTKVEQIKDQLATEMYNFVSKETDLIKCIQELAQIQADYHRQSLGILERVIPQLKENIEFAIKKPVFGQLLQEHLESDHREIAYVLEECIAVLYEFGLAEEGLFRIAGSASKIKKLKAAFNSSQRPVITSEEDVDVHVISSVLKLYLRELPEPLMCSDYYNDWLHTLQKPPEQRLSSMRDVIQKLPRANQQNLRYLIKFLAKLSESSDINKMSPSNISLVIAPNLLWAKGETGPNMLTTGLQSSIVETMVANANYFFPGDIDFSGSRHPLSPPMNNSVDANNGNNVQPSIGLGSITANMLSGFVSPDITHDNTSSSTGSPGTLKRGPKKPPAPLPPSDATPLLHPIFGKSLSSGNGQTSGNTAPRYSAGEPATPCDGSVSPKTDRSSSPTQRHERPKMPPPERPQGPPPEKPNTEKPPVTMEKPPPLREKPGGRATLYQSGPEKPAITTKPGAVGDSAVSPMDKPHTKLYPSLSDAAPDKDVGPAQSHQGHVRQSSYGGVGPRPPRPQPPAPPPSTRP